MSFLVQIFISLVLMVAAYLIMPKPKRASAAASEMDNPTASAGSPIKVVFGTVTIKDPNVLWSGDKSIRTYKVRA